MKFRVYETVTGNDVTDEREWYIDMDGELCYLVEDINCPLYMASGQYYYKAEVRVYQ